MSDYLEFLKSPKDEIVVPFFDMLMRSAPDSLVLGTLLLALLTQSWPYVVLFIAFIEIILLQFLFGTLSSFFTGGIGSKLPDACGFMLPSYSQISILRSLLTASPFPSAPTFFMSAVCAYVLGSTIEQRAEINDLSKKNHILRSRFPISAILSITFIIAFTIWRISKGCDNLLTTMGTVILGFFTGGSLLLLNRYTFGREAINFTGLPLLMDRISNGQPLYVCAESENV